MTRRRDGFALIAAVWIMVALAAIGIEVATLARTRRLAAANHAEEAQARAAADAGIEHARARLARLVNEVPTTPSGVPLRDPWAGASDVMRDTVRLGDTRYVVRCEDANARINVNLAGVAVLERLLMTTGADAELAGRVAQALVDWRDADDLPHAAGAERAAYLRAGLPVLPRNAPLVRIEELRDLYGMTPALFERLHALVTVEGDGTVNVNTAAPAVLRSLPAFSDAVVTTVLRLRAQRVSITSIDQLAAALPGGVRTQLLDAFAELNPLLAFETRRVVVESEGWVTGSPVRTVRRLQLGRGAGAVFVITGRAA